MEPERPPIDIFKAIFENSDSESYDDDSDKEEKTETAQTAVAETSSTAPVQTATHDSNKSAPMHDTELSNTQTVFGSVKLNNSVTMHENDIPDLPVEVAGSAKHNDNRDTEMCERALARADSVAAMSPMQSRNSEELASRLLADVRQSISRNQSSNDLTSGSISLPSKKC